MLDLRAYHRQPSIFPEFCKLDNKYDGRNAAQSPYLRSHRGAPLLSRFGVSATCRASFGLYNTREEVDGLAQALIKAQGFFA
jgi:hypothetical protein